MRGSTIVSPFAWGTPLVMRSVIGVAALPMSIWLQAISCLRPSSEIDLVRPVIACLVAVYGAEEGRGACGEIEPLLMMRPPRGSWSFMMRIASCAQRKLPVRFAFTTFCHCSNVRSSIGIAGAPMPALLKSTSRRPNISFTFAKSARTDSGLATSVGTARARSPTADSCTAACSGSRRRPANTTQYPAFSSACAAPLPIPRVEVVPAPRSGFVWAPGYYAHRNGQYVWMKGHYERERHGQYWHPGHWVEREGRWAFVQPGWHGERFAYNGRGYARDRDHDGVPDFADRAPDNPYRQ